MECPVTAPSPANQPSLTSVDWSSIPAPVDDGAAAHLTGARLPDLALPSTAGGTVRLADLAGWSVLYFYPMTGRPDQPLPEGWDMIPGARGCTPQSCAFRDHAVELAEAGVSALYGISTQDTAWQREAAERDRVVAKAGRWALAKVVPKCLQKSRVMSHLMTWLELMKLKKSLKRLWISCETQRNLAV